MTLSQKRSLPPVQTIHMLRPLTCVGVQGGAIVHVVEIVFRSLGKARRRAAGELRLVGLGADAADAADAMAKPNAQRRRLESKSRMTVSPPTLPGDSLAAKLWEARVHRIFSIILRAFPDGAQ